MLPLAPDAALRHAGFFLALALLSALCVRLAIAWRILDVPNHRSAHARPIPKGGGLGVVVATLVGLLIQYRFATLARLDDPYFLAVIVGAAAIAAVSLADDILSFRQHWKLLAQVAAAIAPLPWGLAIDTLSLPWIGPVPLGPLAWPLTVLWVVFLTNAMNFIDGLDGMCAGIALVAALFLAALALAEGGAFVYVAALSLAAGCAGFLPFNVPRAQIFLGDVGSQFIGYLFAILGIAAARFDQARVSLYIVPLLLAVPIFDVAFTLIRRALAGERLAEAHRGHLYQVLARTGVPPLAVSALSVGMTAVLGLVAFRFVALSPPAKLAVVAGVVAALALYAAWVAWRARRAGLTSWSGVSPARR
ncbi:glycosyltransferase family 4 protein [Elioraea thermophila]|uniref:glycosyltransferase family 4 protein n=1 Tax=Elioraea thermophila TaxID=2185104 RepID=UPI000DF28B8B|nr:MraY family glycosyltransferase [Elioraea thermophila]